LRWDFPGGIIQAGKTVKSALSREIWEEVKLQVNTIKPIFVYTDLSQIPTVQYFLIAYLCEIISGVVRLNQKEHDKTQWLDSNTGNPLSMTAWQRQEHISALTPAGSIQLGLRQKGLNPKLNTLGDGRTGLNKAQPSTGQPAKG